MVARFVEQAPEGDGEGVVALLVPHAAIEFTGPTAAKAYKLLKPGAYRSVIIVGAAHRASRGGAAVYPGRYSTPEGALPYDHRTAEALVAASPLISLDAAAHRGEHSVEVQIPFLRRVLGDIPQVSLIMSGADLDDAREIGRALAEVAKNRRALLIASSDMAQFPEGKAADAVDRTTLAAIGSMDAAYFWLSNRLLLGRGVPHLSETFCGEGALTAVIEAASRLGARRLKVLGHINSGDVVSERDYHHVVGYGAAAFLKEGPERDPLSLTGPEKADLLEFARGSLKSYAAKRLSAPLGLSAKAAFNLPAAVFVTLSSNGGERKSRSGGAVAERSLLEAVEHHAIQAAFYDPVMDPLAPGDVDGLSIEITVLSRIRRASPREVLPGWGASLELGGRSYLMPEAWNLYKGRQGFLGALCTRQAGLRPDCYRDNDAVLSIFKTETF